MLQDYTEDEFDISLAKMLEYLLLLSDNNASNQLFGRFCGTAATDSIIRSLELPSDFNISYTEAEMQADHDKAYDNWSSPLACAALINRVYTDSLMTHDRQECIRRFSTAARPARAHPRAVYRKRQCQNRTPHRKRLCQ